MTSLLVWHDIVYFPNDHYCFIPFVKVRGILWVAFLSYCLPLSYMCLIYIRITIFLRQETNALSLLIKQRQERDLQDIQQLFINVALLLAAGLPDFILLIIFLITGIHQPIDYRVVWVGDEISLTVLSVTIVLMTPQLKKIILTKLRLYQTNVVEFALLMIPTTMTVR